MPKRQVIVIGAGPAGLMAAGQAAKAGAETLLLEKMDRPGRKLRITGKGRCNLTNVDPIEEAIKHFEPSGYFLRPAFYRFYNDDLRAFFADLGSPPRYSVGDASSPSASGRRMWSTRWRDGSERWM